jgi:mannose-6-phosphate isomerase-like protein (cupin superfamily)
LRAPLRHGHHPWLGKDPHAHRRGQLLLSVKGLITCEVAHGQWMVPSQNALWIPPGKIHDMHCIGEVEIYLVFMDASLIGALPAQCCTLAISPCCAN